jgi:hypothetical protein
MREDAAAGPDHRLHNCGPSTREVFRCARVGADHQTDILRSLTRCGPLHEQIVEIRGATRMCEDPAEREHVDPRIPPEIVSSICTRLMERMDATINVGDMANDSECATVLLRSLVGHVVDRGWHRRLLGTASHSQVAPENWWKKPRFSPGTTAVEEVALVVAAYGVYSPPLMLWSRPASLDWLRVDTLLTVRQLWPEERS